jgi:hypothetical protein
MRDGRLVMFDWLRRWRQPKQHTLIAMRLKDMLVVHPRQDNSRVCSRCGQQVGIYPSGQGVIARRPNTIIICQICTDPLDPNTHLASGALDEPFHSVRAPPDYVRKHRQEAHTSTSDLSFPNYELPTPANDPLATLPDPPAIDPGGGSSGGGGASGDF